MCGIEDAEIIYDSCVETTSEVLNNIDNNLVLCMVLWRLITGGHIFSKHVAIKETMTLADYPEFFDGASILDGNADCSRLCAFYLDIFRKLGKEIKIVSCKGKNISRFDYLIVAVLYGNIWYGYDTVSGEVLRIYPEGIVCTRGVVREKRYDLSEKNKEILKQKGVSQNELFSLSDFKYKVLNTMITDYSSFAAEAMVITRNLISKKVYK